MLDEKICVRLNGGLGNQLFQFAAGLKVAHSLDADLIMDVSQLLRSASGVTQRKFELGFMRDSPPTVQVRHPSQLATRLLSTKHRWIADPLQKVSHQFYAAPRGYDSRIEKVRKGTILNGYFQTPRYFQGLENRLLSEIDGYESRTSWCSQLAEKISATPNSVSVHLRRGDYLTQPEGSSHFPLQSDYYRSALSSLDVDLRECHFYIFSDDSAIDPAKFGFEGLSVEIVDPPRNSPPIESMWLMSQTATIVTANSSFSWWSAWLGTTRNHSKVLIPSPWYRDASLQDQEMLIDGCQIVRHSWSSENVG